MEISHPFIRAPFERANQSFRYSQKQVTKEISSLLQRIDNLHQEQQPAQHMNVDVVLEEVQEIRQQILALKAMLKESNDQQEDMLQSSVVRLRHLHDLQDELADAPSQALDDATSTAKDTMETRLVADYLVSQGAIDTSQILQKDNGIETLVDQALYTEMYEVERSLQSHDVSRALRWCTENGTRLRRLQSSLELQLRLQEFVEIARLGEDQKALKYAQTSLMNTAKLQEEGKSRERAIDSVRRVFGKALSCAHPRPHCGHKDCVHLFEYDRWVDLLQSFRSTFRKAYALHDPPSLVLLLHAGLSLLNTRTCARLRAPTTNTSVVSRSDSSQEDSNQQEHQASQESNDSNGHDDAYPDCPTCSQVGGKLCHHLPFTYQPRSRLVCPVTNKVMDDSNPPMALPNGHLYSYEAVSQMEEVHDDDRLVRCVATQKLFTIESVQRVYLS